MLVGINQRKSDFLDNDWTTCYGYKQAFQLQQDCKIQNFQAERSGSDSEVDALALFRDPNNNIIDFDNRNNSTWRNHLG